MFTVEQLIDRLSDFDPQTKTFVEYNAYYQMVINPVMKMQLHNIDRKDGIRFKVNKLRGEEVLILEAYAE